eukprot:TRINITY_DN20665_c0_g2_i2.p1 TRINITY_DN20665_c0_g2~~TRINITY_DN20665_c0_g2_i2.p1  ORF type:complete len:510 (-),score=94.08 TRINITY_DN20665_c0_g2_i2:536-2002(-)
MEPPAQTKESDAQNGRLVLKNTFFEMVEEHPEEDVYPLIKSRIRASSDSKLYKGSVEAAEEEGEFYLDGLSDTETEPDTNRGSRAVPLPCYAHMKNADSAAFDDEQKSTSKCEAPKRWAHTPSPRASGETPYQYRQGTPSLTNRDVAPCQFRDDTPSPRGLYMKYEVPHGVYENTPSQRGSDEAPHKFFEDAACTGTTDDSEKGSSLGDDGSGFATSEDLQRLAAEVARLAEENKKLRQAMCSQDASSADAHPASRWLPSSEVCNKTYNSEQNLNSQWAQSSTVLWMPVTLYGQAVVGEQGLTQQQPQCPRQSNRQKQKAQTHGRQQRSQQMPSAHPASEHRDSKAKTVCSDQPMHQWTTVMLRNLPNNYTRAMLLKMLDDEGFAGVYNFLYLPIDFKTQACLGYAFVNLVDPSQVVNFWSKFSGFSNWVLPSKKVCSVGWSGPHQGLEAHVERYRSSPVMHPSVPDECKPVIFEQGVRVQFPGTAAS